MNRATVALLTLALYLSYSLAQPATLSYPEWRAKLEAKQNRAIEKRRNRDQERDNSVLLQNLQNALQRTDFSNTQHRDLNDAIKTLQAASGVENGYFKNAAYKDAIETLIHVLRQ